MYCTGTSHGSDIVGGVVDGIVGSMVGLDDTAANKSDGDGESSNDSGDIESLEEFENLNQGGLDSVGSTSGILNVISSHETSSDGGNININISTDDDNDDSHEVLEMQKMNLGRADSAPEVLETVMTPPPASDIPTTTGNINTVGVSTTTTQ